MREELLKELRKITEEEKEILAGNQNIQKSLYTSHKDFVVDSNKMLKKGRLIEIRPHTRFAAFPKHRHNYVEMVYMCAGTTEHIINGTDHITLKEGDLLFMHQNTYHEILPASQEDIAVNFIILPEFFLRPISMFDRENVLRDFLVSCLSGKVSEFGFLHIYTKGIVPIENIIESMIWTLISPPPVVNTLNQTSMGLLLMNISSYVDVINRNDPNQQDQNTIYYILKYIETHYKSGSLTEVAETLNVPTYTISKLLKKFTGKNFKELLQNRKMQQAAYLLHNTTLSIEAIIEAIGYDNSSYFYKKFKETYGVSPKEYRNTY